VTLARSTSPSLSSLSRLSPDRALYLPTFSHFVIVKKTSLSLSLSPPPRALSEVMVLGWHACLCKHMFCEPLYTECASRYPPVGESE
jgi:hypothetical protein